MGGARGGRGDIKRHIIAEAGHFIVIGATLKLNFDVADLREMVREGSKEGRINDQFLFLLDAVVNALTPFLLRERGGRLMQLHGGVKGRKERQTTHIAHKDSAP